MLNTPKYSGEPTPQALASGLATLGRYGDEFMVHAAEGETVIPPEIFEANPQLKADLFRQMAMMGIKDPNRYVVGNSLNSINPLTGQPEFFFKKIFKSVKKVFKKALPIIAPIVGNLLLPGIGGLIASGLVTKLQGGSWGDVLKSVAFSYAGNALTSGLSGAFSSAPGATFMGGLTKGLTAPFTAASNLFSSGAGAGTLSGMGPNAIMGPGGGLPTGSTPIAIGSTPLAGNAGEFVGGTYVGGGTPSGITSAIPGSELVSGAGLTDTLSGMGPNAIMGPGGGLPMGLPAVKLTPSAVGTQANPFTAQTVYTPTTDPTKFALTPTASAFQEADLAAADADASYSIKNAQSTNTPEQGFVDKALYALDPSVEAAETARYAGLAKAQKGFAADHMKAYGKEISADVLGAQSAKWLAANPVPGLLSRSAPLIAATGAAGLGIAALSGAFTEEEEEYKANPNKSDKEIEAYEKWGQIPDKNSLEAQKQFGIWNMKPYVTRSQFEAQTGGRSDRPDWRFLPESNVMGVAMGGEVVGPGTGTSDSIPARLSDGEFVMTADAVRNAGGGNRDLGAARMYDMMRRFEGGVA